MPRKSLTAGAVVLAGLVSLTGPAAHTQAFTLVERDAGHRSLVGDSGSDAEASLDVRKALAALKPTPAQVAAFASLADAVPGDGSPRVTWNRAGTPRTISVAGGWLTGPRSGDAVTVARAWISANRALLGLEASDVSALAVTRDHTLPGDVATVVTFAQTFGGVEAVQGGRLTVAVGPDGRVLSFAGDSYRAGDLLGGWTKSAASALATAVETLAPASNYVPETTGKTLAGYQEFAAGPFATVQRVRKVVFPTVDGGKPSYSVLFAKSTSEVWSVIVDAQSGAILARESLVQHDSEGTVYENFPGAPAGGQPVVKSFGPSPESPGGWVDPTGAAGLPGPTTLGNNADSFANWEVILAPTGQANRPVSPTSQFNYAFADNWGRTQCAEVPPSYALDRDPSVTNLFFHHNRIHDEYYKFGFTPSGGNFEGGDPVLGLAQSGAASGGEASGYLGRNNANFLTLPDGLPGLTSMYLWQPITDAFHAPCRDGSFDSTVIQHEYSHGLSNRYVGGGGLGSLSSHQSQSMGEGWGDWYAVNHLWREGLYDKAVVGEYATGNGERGIRNWPFDQSPLTFGDIGFDVKGPESHSDGEIWTAVLWDLRSALVARHGNRAGSDVAEHLVTDAMPLSPASPSMLDMRDAILNADTARYQGEHTDVLWAVFAKRGMGASASTADGDDTDPTPAFDHAAPSRNGAVSGKVVNAVTGTPVKGARIVVGEFEARVSPVTRSNDAGQFGFAATGGTYTVTVQAPGFGIQKFRNVVVSAGSTKHVVLKVAANLASQATGASIVSTSSASATHPAAHLIDDTESTQWRTADHTLGYTADPLKDHVTVKLAQQASISRIGISALMGPDLGRFASAKDVTIQTSTDGVVFTTAKRASFPQIAPRPQAPDMQVRYVDLEKPVTARYVRVFVNANQGTTTTHAYLAELQVFSKSAAIEVPPPPPYVPVHFTDSGTVTGMAPQMGPAADVVESVISVTGAAFANTCPSDLSTFSAQGVDGWVTKVPAANGNGYHTVSVTGTSAIEDVGFDLDVYFFDASCALIGSVATSAAEETGLMPAGTAFVLTQVYTGANTTITLDTVNNP